MKIHLFLAPVAACLSSCGNGPPIREDSVLVVKEVGIPKSEPLVARFARHTWLDYRESIGSKWRRIEIVNKNSGLIHRELKPGEFEKKTRWGGEIVVLGQSDGKENPNFVNEIDSYANGYDAGVYRPYPGPNSNTFAENLLREVDGVSAVLDHNAIGKEWGFHFGRTAGGSGIEVETPVFGLALGLREGIELSMLGFSGGFSVFPPALKIPVLPQRLSSFRHDGKESEEHLVAIAIEFSFVGHHGFDLIGEAEGEHGLGFFFLDIRFGENAIEGLSHVGSFGRVQLFLDGGEEILDSFVHGWMSVHKKDGSVKSRLFESVGSRGFYPWARVGFLARRTVPKRFWNLSMRPSVSTKVL